MDIGKIKSLRTFISKLHETQIKYHLTYRPTNNALNRAGIVQTDDLKTLIKLTKNFSGTHADPAGWACHLFVDEIPDDAVDVAQIAVEILDLSKEEMRKLFYPRESSLWRGNKQVALDCLDEMIKKHYDDIIDNLSVDDIFDAVGLKARLSKEVLYGNNTSAEIVRYRQLAIYICTQLLEFKDKHIATLLDLHPDSIRRAKARIRGEFDKGHPIYKEFSEILEALGLNTDFEDLELNGAKSISS